MIAPGGRLMPVLRGYNARFGWGTTARFCSSIFAYGFFAKHPLHMGKSRVLAISRLLA